MKWLVRGPLVDHFMRNKRKTVECTNELSDAPQRVLKHRLVWFPDRAILANSSTSCAMISLKMRFACGCIVLEKTG